MIACLILYFIPPLAPLFEFAGSKDSDSLLSGRRSAFLHCFTKDVDLIFCFLLLPRVLPHPAPSWRSCVHSALALYMVPHAAAMQAMLLYIPACIVHVNVED